MAVIQAGACDSCSGHACNHLQGNPRNRRPPQQEQRKPPGAHCTTLAGSSQPGAASASARPSSPKAATPVTAAQPGAVPFAKPLYSAVTAKGPANLLKDGKVYESKTLPATIQRSRTASEAQLAQEERLTIREERKQIDNLKAQIHKLETQVGEMGVLLSKNQETIRGLTIEQDRLVKLHETDWKRMVSAYSDKIATLETQLSIMHYNETKLKVSD